MTTEPDYKQIAYKLQSDIDFKVWEKSDTDLKFLREIKQRLMKGIEKR